MVSYSHKAPLPDPGGQSLGRHREHSGRKDEHMKRTHQRFLSLLLALVMVFGLMPMGTLVIAAEGTGTDLGLTVTARYMTNRLTWNAESGVSYRVERSADNRSWEQLATVDAGSYLDETADMGTRYYYRLTTGDSQTAGVQGSVTGMAALKENAVLFYQGDDVVAFNGSNKVAIAEGEKAAELNAMNSGTILYKAHFNAVSGKQAVLGTDNGLFVGSHDTKAIMSGPQMVADTEFITAFTGRMANAVHCPVKREMPANMKENLDYYLCRKRRP